MRTIATALLLAAFGLPLAIAQTPAAKSFVGTVTAFKTGLVVEIKPDNGPAVDVKLTPTTVAQRIAPGEKTLQNAVTATVTELATGDRVLVTLEPDSANARRIVIMSAADISKRDEADRQDWNTRGFSGIVATRDGNTITLRVRSLQGETRQTVTVSDRTKLRRYAPDSVRFADAKPSKLEEISVGDQLRARGDKSPDGAAMTADEVVFGTFLATAGSVVSVDTAAKEITIKEIGTGKPLVIKLTPDSRIKQMPALAGMGGGAGGRAGPAGPPPGGFPGGGPPPGMPPAGMPAGGAPTVAQMVETMPSGTVEDVKAGQTVVVSSTKGATSGRVTAIMLVANAELLVQMASAPSGPGAAANGQNGTPPGMPPGGMPGGMDLGSMLGGFGLPSMGP
jgi:hypothetical protein